MAACSDSKESPIGRLEQPIGQRLVLESEPNALPTATRMGSNAVVRGNIFPAADVDYYSFTGQAGDRVYAATMTLLSGNNSADSVLELIGSDGVSVLEADNDNGSFGTTSSSIAGAVLPAAGTYYLSVRSSLGTTIIIPYDLHFQLRSGAPVAETETNDAIAQPLPASGWVSGDLSSAGDIDLYSIRLNAGDTLFASLDLDPERDSVTWDGLMVLLPFTNLFVNDSGTEGGFDSEALFATVQSAGTYEVRVASADSSFGSYHLSVGVHPGAPATASCTTYSSTSVPITLGPATGQVTSTITVPGNPRVADLDVSLQLAHTAPPDLDIRLRAPGGNEVGLLTDVGTASFPAWNFTLDDEAAFPVSTFPQLNGLNVQPENATRLDWFDGQPAGGVWTLLVDDDTANNGGTLDGWSLTLCEPPVFACAGATAPTSVFSTDFETDAAGFSHSGALDEWERGTPNSGVFTSCNSGSGCFKTDLGGNYENSSNQNLVSPAIDLTHASGSISVAWAMKFSLESTQFDKAFVQIQEVGGANPRPLWQWIGPTMQQQFAATPNVLQAAGWGVYRADATAYAGKNVELVFHLDSDDSVGMGGVAIDDVAVSACGICGDGVVTAGEQCDDHNRTNGDCCSSTCRYEAAGSACADANLCNGAETCNSTGSCVAGTPLTLDDGNACTSDVCTALGGVTHSPVTPGTACADSDPCNGDETCNASGTCLAGTPRLVCGPDPAGGAGGEAGSATGGEAGDGAGGALSSGTGGVSGTGETGGSGETGGAGETGGEAGAGAGDGGKAGEPQGRADAGGEAGEGEPPASGGKAPVTSGRAGTAGSAGVGGHADGGGLGGSAGEASTPLSDREGGCSCALPGDSERGGLSWSIAGLFGLLVMRRRRR